MFTVDINLQTICQQSEIDLQQQNPYIPNFCLSFILLLLIYSTLLYNYLSALRQIIKMNLLAETDIFDKILISMAIARLMNIYTLFLGNDVILAISVFMLLWDFIIFVIFLKLAIESSLIIKRMCWFLVISYIAYLLWSNLADQAVNQQIHLSIFYPMIFLNTIICGIGVFELWKMKPALRPAHPLTRTIRVQLLNRFSFVFLVVGCSLISHILVIFPQVLREAMGTVFYFVFLDWLPLLIIYLCVPRRILKENSKQQQNSNSEDSQNSLLIEIQLNPIKK